MSVTYACGKKKSVIVPKSFSHAQLNFNILSKCYHSIFNSHIFCPKQNFKSTKINLLPDPYRVDRLF